MDDASASDSDASPVVEMNGSGRGKEAVLAIGVAVIVTGLVTAAAAIVPDRYVATVVAFIFLGATWALVWRADDRRIDSSGLSLGGIVLPGKLDYARVAGSVARAVGWALLLAVIFFVPFYFGWRQVWHPRGSFALHVHPFDALNEAFGQVIIIALPEEAFYRGYLQSRLDEAMPGFGWRTDRSGSPKTPVRLRVLGTSVGPALFVTSVVFALGHIATIHEPARLAVFFPSLVFGWLRQRTGGVGAGIAFHAMCNLFSEALGKGFRVY